MSLLFHMQWLILISLIFGYNCENLQVRTFAHCQIANFQKKFDILPGRGWDNLNNDEMGQVLNLNFSKCQYSQDNIYLLPNDVSITPLKVSQVELNSESFSHFQNYTSTTSQSINAEAHGAFFGVSLSASFSYEKQNVKSSQIQTKSSITRVQLRYNVFKSISEADAELHPTFRNRVLDIAGLIVEDKDYLYPAYLADMIVRDYGTHVIHSIDAGAVLSKIDFLSSTYSKKYESNSNKISVSASASFGSIFGMSAKYSNRASQTDIDEYDKSCEKTKIETHGGTLYGANFTLEQWRLSVLDNLIPIDRTGKPIYYVITPGALPELDHFTVNKVYNLIKEAVDRYYSANARKGCLDMNAPNFNADANIDGQNCETPNVSFNFGGVYQTCSGPSDQCQSTVQVNPLTGGFSCSKEYQSVLLHGGLNRCNSYCHSYWIFWKKCETICSNYNAYWCYPLDVNNTHSGYRFGGFISNTMKTCPLDFFPLKLTSFAQMCVSINNDPLNADAIKFGGLYSCSVGNPLAREYVSNKKNSLQSSPLNTLKNWPKMCAKGYISHVVTIAEGCQISYCTETNKVSLGQLPLLIKPPFITLNYNPNSTKVVVFSTAEGKLMLKSQLGNWETDEVKIKERNIIFGSVFGTLTIVILLSGIVFIFQRRSYKKKIVHLQRQQASFNTTAENYGAINDDNESA